MQLADLARNISGADELRIGGFCRTPNKVKQPIPDTALPVIPAQ
jgi:hypothetical protein